MPFNIQIQMTKKIKVILMMKNFQEVDPQMLNSNNNHNPNKIQMLNKFPLILKKNIGIF